MMFQNSIALCLTALICLFNVFPSNAQTFIEECVHDPMELAIILDSSSSVSTKDFNTAKTFLQNFVQQYAISQQGVRISILTYGKGIYPQDGFDLTTYDNTDDVVEAIGKVPHRAGPYTATWTALDYMNNVQLADTQVRKGVAKVCIVITDGNSQIPRKTKAAAEAALARNITMFAVGVGSRVNPIELTNIAGGDDSRVTRVKNYDALDGIKMQLLRETCTKKIVPPTEPPKTESCGEKHPTDINFVFSPASLGLDATAWTTSFISHTISSNDIQEGFQYGVISGSCPEEEGFALNAYNDINDIKERLDDYDRTRLPQLMKRLASEGFSSKAGGRSGARRVAVIVASSEQKGVQKMLDNSVAELTKAGIRVFVADPYGGSLEVAGAETLPGGSSRVVSEYLISLLCDEGN